MRRNVLKAFEVAFWVTVSVAMWVELGPDVMGIVVGLLLIRELLRRRRRGAPHA